MRSHLSFPASALIALALGGCGDAGDRTVTTESVRDALSADASHLDQLGPADWRSLAERVRTTAAEDSGWQHLEGAATEVRASDNSYPINPLGNIAHLDLARFEGSQDARLFGVYGANGAGAWSTPCAPQPGELGRHRGEPLPLTDAWRDGSPADANEGRALSGSLQQWANRCAAAVGDKFPSDPSGTVYLQREENAPFLLAYWPQRRKIYVHPALLTLVASNGQTAEPELTTRTSALITVDTAVVDTCLNQVSAHCEMCDTQPKAEANEICDQIFPNTTVFSDCTTLRDQIANGYELYCIDKIYRSRTAVESCVKTNAGSGCDRSSVVVNSVSTLVQAYGAYGSSAVGETCRAQATACAADPSVDNSPQPEPEPEPGPSDEDEEKPGCADNLGCDDC